MAENSHISWTDHTFNPWLGCTKVSPACTNCYAEVDSPVRQSRSIGLELWGPKAKRRVNSEHSWNDPLRWNRQAAKEGRRFRVFCASLADVFEKNDDCEVVNHKNEPMYLNYATTGGDLVWSNKNLPESQPLSLHAMRHRLFALIEQTPHLDWLLLTKRPENVLSMVHPRWMPSQFPPNVWMGTTVENQEYADQRIPHLLEIPARIRFLSCEPMVGPIELSNLTGWKDNRLAARWLGRPLLGEQGIHWVIAGGESGKDARPAHPNWYRSLRDQCIAAGVPYHFKQWGEWLPFTKNYGGIKFGENRELLSAKVDGKEYSTLEYDENDDGIVHIRVGKKAAGRVLEGVVWDKFPK